LIETLDYIFSLSLKENSFWRANMRLKVSVWLPFLFILSAFSYANAQSVPCAAITRNPQVLEALLDSHSNDAEEGRDEGTITVAGIEHLHFNAISIQPGDALYVEYRGRDFTVTADFASGEMIAFDASPKGSYEQWRKGILPLDIFHAALQQRLTRLRVTAKNPDQVLLRNIRIIRAGKPVFEFAKLTSYGKPQMKTAVQRQLPCVGFDDAPGPESSTAVNYSFSNQEPLRHFSGGLVRPMLPPFPMMQASDPTGDTNHYKFTGKELDDETGLYNYGARYFSPGLGRFVTPDWSAKPVPIPYANLKDPQTLNLFSYVRNNPTSLPDPDGHAVQLSDDEAKRKQQLAAAQKAVGKDGGKYLYDNTDKDGHHYIGIYSKGPDGKGPDFKDVNGVANKLNSIIQDPRIAFVATVPAGTNVSPDLGRDNLIGPTTSGMTPGGSRPINQMGGNEIVYMTAGDAGKLDGSLTSTGRDAPISSGDLFSHEIGHVFARWFGGDSNTSSVQMENDTRRLNGEPTRTGHAEPNDVPH
jgi:RHS repeat-associated protein